MNGAELNELLAAIPAKLSAWRDQGQQLALMLVAARIDGRVSDDLHVSIERTCTAIYDEIESCSAVIKRVAETSADAAADLAPLDSALRLVLMEITELGTEFYAIHSGKVERKLLLGSNSNDNGRAQRA
ncbi:MAG: hypothetical protein ABIQ30_11650 [Devosia sp.]